MIISPFSGGNMKGYRQYLRDCVKDSLTRGEAPFASHGFYPQYLRDKDQDERAIGMECGQLWLERADYLAVYEDHGISAGMALDMAAATNPDNKYHPRIVHRRLKKRRIPADILDLGPVRVIDVEGGEGYDQGRNPRDQSGLVGSGLAPGDPSSNLLRSGLPGDVRDMGEDPAVPDTGDGRDLPLRAGDASPRARDDAKGYTYRSSGAGPTTVRTPIDPQEDDEVVRSSLDGNTGRDPKL